MRKVVDCRDAVDENCTLTLVGEEDEVLEAAVEHKVAAHGLDDTPELRTQLRMQMKDETALWSGSGAEIGATG